MFLGSPLHISHLSIPTYHHLSSSYQVIMDFNSDGEEAEEEEEAPKKKKGKKDD